jgi:hypothetical protein
MLNAGRGVQLTVSVRPRMILEPDSAGVIQGTFAVRPKPDNQSSCLNAPRICRAVLRQILQPLSCHHEFDEPVGVLILCEVFRQFASVTRSDSTEGET